MVEKLLGQLGLNKKEVEVYLAIVQSGKVSAARVSALTGINRTTVYSVAKNLKKMGIISEDLGASTVYFTALDPSGLKNLLLRERRAIEEKEKIVSDAITELQPLVARVNYSVPRMQFVEEENIEDHLYRQTPRWLESLAATDKVWCGFQDHTFVEKYKKWIYWSWQQKPLIEDLRLLTNQSDVEKEVTQDLPKQRQMKYWSGSQKEFDATTWVMGDYVVMAMTRERPHYLVEIHDAVLARNQRALFAGIWEEIGRK